MKLVADERGKLGYLTGEMKKPAKGDPTFRTWRSENSLITAWLLNSMEPFIATPNMFMATVKDVGDSVHVHESLLDLENSSQIFELKSKLWQFKQGDSEVTVIITRW